MSIDFARIIPFALKFAPFPVAICSKIQRGERDAGWLAGESEEHSQAVRRDSWLKSAIVMR